MSDAGAIMTRCLLLFRDSLSGGSRQVASGVDPLLLLFLFPSGSYSMRTSTSRLIYLSFRLQYEKSLAVVLLFLCKVYCW